MSRHQGKWYSIFCLFNCSDTDKFNRILDVDCSIAMLPKKLGKVKVPYKAELYA